MTRPTQTSSFDVQLAIMTSGAHMGMTSHKLNSSSPLGMASLSLGKFWVIKIRQASSAMPQAGHLPQFIVFLQKKNDMLITF